MLFVFCSSSSARFSAALPGSLVSIAASASSPGGCTNAWTANLRMPTFSTSISACLAATAASAATWVCSAWFADRCASL